MKNNRLKTRPKTEDELLEEFNAAKQAWREGRCYSMKETLKRLDDAIKRAEERENDN